jgi:hypothetical protein
VAAAIAQRRAEHTFAPTINKSSRRLARRARSPRSPRSPGAGSPGSWRGALAAEQHVSRSRSPGSPEHVHRGHAPTPRLRFANSAHSKSVFGSSPLLPRTNSSSPRSDFEPRYLRLKNVTK